MGRAVEVVAAQGEAEGCLWCACHARSPSLALALVLVLVPVLVLELVTPRRWLRGLLATWARSNPVTVPVTRFVLRRLTSWQPSCGKAQL
jgi:hypothetical protein